jgi:uncharacterized repeat protein (TIGR03803 family)
MLHAFNGTDGAAPEASLITDAQGNLYGTTYSGGTGSCDGGCGTVFELSPDSSGGYTEHVLHDFQGALADGQQPQASLIFGQQGNLYGTTYAGGQSVTAASGTVFELSPNGDGTWTEIILHSFNGALDGGTDGGEPQAGLIFDAAGNLYGTTAGGGTGTGCVGGNGCGTVFELMPESSGTWHEKILHNFTNNHQDGFIPMSTLVMDGSGDFYGTTYYGGSGGGTVFRIKRTAGGWEENVVYAFPLGVHGCNPYSGLAHDTEGNLYGTTVGCGSHPGDGTVYKLTHETGGGWTPSVIHTFTGAADGVFPYGNPTLDTAGNVYGTTLDGGGTSALCSSGCGVVFKLTPAGADTYTESILASFGNGNGGSGPLAGLTIDANGNIFGTAAFGAPNGEGAVFEIIP